MGFYRIIVSLEEKDDANDIKAPKPEKSKAPKLAKCKAKLISPQLLACKIEMNTVEMPPALRQRNIQLQALNSTRSTGELLSPQSVTITSVENDLRNRKKAIVIQNVNQSSSTGTTTSDEDSGPDENAYFESHLVIEFSPDIQKKTLHWIIDKIRTKVARGGAGLLVRREPQTK